MPVAKLNKNRRSPDSAKPKALILNRFPFKGTVYSDATIRTIREHFDVLKRDLSGQQLHLEKRVYPDVEVLFGTWGLPPLKKDFLAFFPKLKAVFHAAGAWESLYTEAARQRKIAFHPTVDLNSNYVARQTAASILLALKGFFQSREALRDGQTWEEAAQHSRGIHRSKIGIVGLGRIGLKVVSALRRDGIPVVAHDPGLSHELIRSAGARAMTLEAIFEECQVVSLHLPASEDTRHMVGRSLLSRMPEGAALVNTSRGAVINESDLVTILKQRPDLVAILDVCDPEPPASDSPLLAQTNCFLTPHISGAIGTEREHLGEAALEAALQWLRDHSPAPEGRTASGSAALEGDGSHTHVSLEAKEANQ